MAFATAGANVESGEHAFQRGRAEPDAIGGFDPPQIDIVPRVRHFPPVPEECDVEILDDAQSVFRVDVEAVVVGEPEFFEAADGIRSANIWTEVEGHAVISLVVDSTYAKARRND